MGQYWYPVNLDKKEFIDPHKLKCGLKLWEQLASHPATGAALIILLAAEREERGGGDLQLETADEKYNEIAKRTIGRWAGDRIALVGDYAEDSDLPSEFNASKIFKKCDEGEYKDITEDVKTVILRELAGVLLAQDFTDAKGTSQSAFISFWR